MSHYTANWPNFNHCLGGFPPNYYYLQMHCQQRSKKLPINALFTMHAVFSVPGTTPPGVAAAFHIEVEAVQRHAIWNVIPYTVTLKHRIYVGGGGTISDDPHTVYEYHPQEDRWLKLERYPYRWFAMAVFCDKLTLVGGRTSTWPSIMVNRIAVWGTKGTSQQWTDPYPRMPTHRALPAVATYNHWLVVAGGWNDINLDTVELLNTDSQQWLSTTQLPLKCCNMTTTIVEDHLYLLGGTLSNQVLSIHLPTITAQSPNITKSSAQWHNLPPAPLEWSAGIALCGSLLAVGGNDGNDCARKAIYVYQPDTKEWSKVGDLPTERSHCSCTLLPSGEIVVAGGFKSSGYPSSRVDAAAID